MAESRFSLFGTPTPEQVRSQIMGQQRQEALQMAAMPAGRGMVALGHQAGSGLGGLLSQAMGGDPYGEQAARAQQELMQGIMSNAMEVGQGDWAATYEAAIDGLMQAGLHDRAFETMNELRDIQNTEAQIAERTASAERSGAKTELERAALDLDEKYKTTRLTQFSRRLDQLDRSLNLAQDSNNIARLRQRQADVINDMYNEYRQTIMEHHDVEDLMDIEDRNERVQALNQLRQFVGAMDAVSAQMFTHLLPMGTANALGNQPPREEEAPREGWGTRIRNFWRRGERDSNDDGEEVFMDLSR